MIESFIFGLGAFLVFVAVFALVLRAVKVSPYFGFIAFSLIVHLITVLLGASIIQNWTYWYCATAYWSATLLYLFAMGAFTKSVTLMMLQSIYRTPNKMLAPQDLYQKYVLGKFEERAQLLVNAGNVVQVEGKFKISERGQRLASVWRRLQMLFGIQTSGLYFTNNPSLFPAADTQGLLDDPKPESEIEQGPK